MDCIYKTNYYQILFYIISRVTRLNINFYIRFAFFFSKIPDNYIWILEYLV